MDDLDTPRNKAGAASAILSCLEAFGLHWDGDVYYQSQHLEDYRHFLAELDSSHCTYPCRCSRKALADWFADADSALDPNIYPRLCRDTTLPEGLPYAVRLKTENDTVAFRDRLQGDLSHNMAKQHGDFILKRKDGIIAYQFAVVVDDALQRVNHVVRGCDLLEETPKQIYVQQRLGLPTPSYAHFPVIVDPQGHKLSKQTLATAVDAQTSDKILFDLLGLLKQNPPGELCGAAVSDILAWAVCHWCPDTLVGCKTISLSA